MKTRINEYGVASKHAAVPPILKRHARHATTAHTKPNEVIVRVHYPVTAGRLVLRVDSDWAADIEASAVTENGQCAEFRLAITGTYHYFKPVLQLENALRWAQSKNYLLLPHGPSFRNIYPTFFDDAGCTVCALKELAEPDSAAPYQYRVFTPPGYEENTLKRYPVLYLQDGQNVFFLAHRRMAQTGGFEKRSVS